MNRLRWKLTTVIACIVLVGCEARIETHSEPATNVATIERPIRNGYYYFGVTSNEVYEAGLKAGREEWDQWAWCGALAGMEIHLNGILILDPTDVTNRAWRLHRDHIEHPEKYP